MDNNSDLNELIDELKENFVKLVEKTEKEVAIDEFEIDTEALRTPKIHQKYSVMLSQESVKLVKLGQIQKKIYMERWKYYNGKQTDKYYAKHGHVNDKILKSDIDKYMNADARLACANELLEIQKQTVNYLERTIREISNRGFHIKAFIDWRRFESGV